MERQKIRILCVEINSVNKGKCIEIARLQEEIAKQQRQLQAMIQANKKNERCSIIRNRIQKNEPLCVKCQKEAPCVTNTKQESLKSPQKQKYDLQDGVYRIYKQLQNEQNDMEESRQKLTLQRGELSRKLVQLNDKIFQIRKQNEAIESQERTSKTIACSEEHRKCRVETQREDGNFQLIDNQLNREIISSYDFEQEYDDLDHQEESLQMELEEMGIHLLQLKQSENDSKLNSRKVKYEEADLSLKYQLQVDIDQSLREEYRKACLSNMKFREKVEPAIRKQIEKLQEMCEILPKRLQKTIAVQMKYTASRKSLSQRYRLLTNLDFHNPPV